MEMFENTSTDAETASSSGSASVLALQCAAPDLSLPIVRLSSGMTLGRDDSCSVRLSAAAASRLHATVTLRAGLWWCEDAGSRNGTFINGQRMESSPVGPGDVLRCGEWIWAVVRVPSAEPYRGFHRLADGLHGGAVLQHALEPIRRAAATNLPVIVEGETGTGKERVATAVHTWSQRNGKLIAVNCATLAGPLAEGELFGYRKGAFTGAERHHDGFIRAAQGGTLLLDEICELPLPTQAKLLRVLEEQQVVPLGESLPIRIDVRIIAAAQQSLERLVAARRFRADLLARLKGVLVRLPPLRDRREDIPHLFDLFLTQQGKGCPARIHARLMEAIMVHSHPENVRGLWQLARQLVCVHGDQPVLRRSHLPLSFATPDSGVSRNGEPGTLDCRAPHQPESAGGSSARIATDDDWPALLSALEETKGNVVQAAIRVGLSRHQAYRLMKGNGYSALNHLRRNERS